MRRISKKKYRALELFDYHQQFMVDLFDEVERI